MTDEAPLSAYTACFTYDDAAPFRVSALPGSHDLEAAIARARRVVAAMRAAGETDVRAHIGFAGERPANFPRNGVTLRSDGSWPDHAPSKGILAPATL